MYDNIVCCQTVFSSAAQSRLIKTTTGWNNKPPLVFFLDLLAQFEESHYLLRGADERLLPAAKHPFKGAAVKC